MDFSKKLVETLVQQKMSQADLCKKTGIPSSLMANYCSGKKSPALSNAIAIADAFQISLDELVGKKANHHNALSGSVNEALKIFDELSPMIQEHALKQIKDLLELQNRIKEGN